MTERDYRKDVLATLSQTHKRHMATMALCGWKFTTMQSWSWYGYNPEGELIAAGGLMAVVDDCWYVVQHGKRPKFKWENAAHLPPR